MNEPVNQFSNEPVGGVIAVMSKGIRYREHIIRKARIAVSAGSPPQVYQLLENLKRAITSKRTEVALQAASQIDQWLAMIPQKNESMHPNFALYAIETVEKLNTDRSLDNEERKLLAYLKEQGYNEIRVVIGDMFDESYSPSKYDRRKIKSHDPKGKIVKLLKRGFLDRNGLPVQKAIVGISDGTGG